MPLEEGVPQQMSHKLIVEGHSLSCFNYAMSTALSLFLKD